MANIIKTSITALIHIYRFMISSLLGPCCRFEPSCSAYALEALKRHGCMKGTSLAAWRILRCNPWHPGGIDPVPN